MSFPIMYPVEMTSHRDIVAMHALPAVLTQIYDATRRTGNYVDIPKEAAMRAYEIADAMLAARGTK